MSPTTAADFPPIFPTSNGSNFADKKPCNGLGFDFSNNGFNGSGGFVFVFGAKHDKSASEFGLGKKSSADDPLSKLCGGFKGLNIDSDIDKDKVFGNNGDFDAGKESFSEFGGKFEFCASRSDATEKSMKKKTRGKARQSLHSPLNQKDQVFSLSGNATENVPRYSGIFFIATENSKPTSGNNEPCKKPEISSKIQQETEPKPSEQDGLSARRDRPKKKYRLKVGKTPAAQNSPRVVKGSAELKNVGLNSECERWRMRGNQAYNNEDMSKADQFYTNGINCVRGKNVEGFYSKSLALCYNNRAATRMSFGRLREALQDCKFAARENPAFLKAKLRAANCHLLLGEIEEAIHNYNDCLEDTRLMIEANEGIQKALQVSDSLCQSANNLQQTTSDAARAALKEINKGLSISSYSERLLEMRGQSLFLLRRYNEVIDLCEKTLADAEKNFQNSERQWRWCLMSKCQLHLGRLEVAKDLTERLEYVSPLAASIGECLHRKKAGNEAFQSGKHSEAVEHYTAAISSSLEFDSRPFAALCYCNRAAAHQALGQVADAIADCSVAIALDGEYVKAVSRRASLHESIRDYKQAIADLYKTLPLSEKSAQMELKRRVSLLEEKTKHEEAPMDFYLILGMKALDSEADIKKAYKRAALKHHPDKACQYLARMNSGKSWKEVIEKVHEDAERLFKMIGEAYAVLSDADKRSNYDSEEQIRNYPFCSARRSSKYDYDQNFGSYNYHSPYEKYQNSGSYRRYRRNWHPDF